MTLISINQEFIPGSIIPSIPFNHDFNLDHQDFKPGSIITSMSFNHYFNPYKSRLQPAQSWLQSRSIETTHPNQSWLLSRLIKTTNLNLSKLQSRTIMTSDPINHYQTESIMASIRFNQDFSRLNHDFNHDQSRFQTQINHDFKPIQLWVQSLSITISFPIN